MSRDYRLMAASLVKMGAADGEVNLDSFALDIERVIQGLGSMEAQLDASAIIDETGTVSYDASINLDQEVRSCLPGGELVVIVVAITVVIVVVVAVLVVIVVGLFTQGTP